MLNHFYSNSPFHRQEADTRLAKEFAEITGQVGDRAGVEPRGPEYHSKLHMVALGHIR